MGMKQKVEVLEAKLRHAEKKLETLEYMKEYIKTLAEMPDDACLSYTHCGMEISHQIGKSARVALSMIEKS